MVAYSGNDLFNIYSSDILSFVRSVYYGSVNLTLEDKFQC